MAGQRDYVFNGPVDLAALRDLDLRNCHLHFNGPFRLQDLAGVRLADATVIINPQVPSLTPAPGYLSDKGQPSFGRSSSFDHAQDGGFNVPAFENPIVANTRKRARPNHEASNPPSAVSDRAHEDMTEGRLRYDDFEEGEIEPSQPRKRPATSSSDAFHPARARMLEQLNYDDAPDDTVEVLVDRRTKANTAPMPFNRLNKKDRKTDGGMSNDRQEVSQQTPNGAPVTYDTTMSGTNNLRRADIGAVDKFPDGAEATLQNDQNRHGPPGYNSWPSSGFAVTQRAPPSIRVALPSSPISIVSINTSNQGAGNGATCNGQVVGGHALNDQQTIKQEPVENVSGLHLNDSPVYISTQNTTEVESPKTNPFHPSNGGQATANERDGLSQGLSSRRSIVPGASQGDQAAGLFAPTRTPVPVAARRDQTAVSLAPTITPTAAGRLAMSAAAMPRTDGPNESDGGDDRDTPETGNEEQN